MSDYFSDPESGTCLVFLINRKKKGWRPDKYFPKKYLRAFSPLKAKGLLTWARDEARRKKISIPDDLLNEIIAAVGGSPGSIAGAIEKLYLYKNPGVEVTSDDVMEIVGSGRKDTIFDLTGLIVMKKTARALELLKKLLDEGEAPLKILALMIRAFRQLWLGIDSWEKEENLWAACKAAGFWGDKNKFIDQVKRLRPDDIPSIYRQLVETDGALKGGEKLNSLTLERLVIELAAIGN